MSIFNQYPYLNVNDLNLDWIISHFKEFIDEIGSLESWRASHEQEYNNLKKLVDDLYSGNWSPEFVNTLVNWYKDNIVDIIGEMIKTVHFGLTNDGYFCAHIPSSWSDVHFSTITDYDSPLYGHLVLEYD